MFALDNRTPFGAEHNWIRDKDGAHHWVVAVTATYDIGEDGTLSIAEEQPNTPLATEYWGEDGVSSIRYESDLGLQKPCTDLLVNGTAYASGGRPVSSMAVRLRAPGVDKTLQVSGESTFLPSAFGVQVSTPKPFTSMPIRYEATFGGSDTVDPDPRRHAHEARNPIGTGFALRPERLEGKRAPSITYPGVAPHRSGPAGFGATASYWEPRLGVGGTYDQRWFDEQRPFLPNDWSPECLRCAPMDQRPKRWLSGDDRIELYNMSPSGALAFALPKVYLTFATHFGRRVEEHRSKLVTVLVESDSQTLRCVWHSSLRVPLGEMDYLDKTVIKEKPYL
ncbi:MAG: hypothetical protein CSA65_01880 [Proteobacteria bacterium]|nr:MAG: hypothetical protein CSA65_01880 [Pseudomonadota bacterium]